MWHRPHLLLLLLLKRYVGRSCECFYLSVKRNEIIINMWKSNWRRDTIFSHMSHLSVLAPVRIVRIDFRNNKLTRSSKDQFFFNLLYFFDSFSCLVSKTSWTLLSIKNFSWLISPKRGKLLFSSFGIWYVILFGALLASPFQTERVLDLTDFFFYSSQQKVVQAITQPPFGVGTSSLDTMCFSIRSCAFWGFHKFLAPHDGFWA